MINLNKNKYQIYELYGAGDGNDDILSDIGSGDEVRHGMWALIPQGVEDSDESINEVEVPSVQEYSLDNAQYAQALADMLTKKVGLPKPTYIKGGSFGHAFRIGNELVLKLTTSNSEVESALKTIKHGPPTYLAEIFDVYKIVDTEKNKAYFAIIQEYIPDRPSELFEQYNEIIDEIMPYGLESFKIIKKIRKGGTLDEVQQIAKGILTENPESGVSERDRMLAYKYIMGLFNIQQELNKFNIRSDDYTNTGNLGYKNGVLKFFDVGNIFTTPEPTVPQQDIVFLPEDFDLLQNVDFLNEDYDRGVADKLAFRVAKLRGYGEPRFIGSGSFGVAYDIGNDKVLKITKDNSEARETLSLINKPLKYIAQPYEVFHITSESFSGLPETYGIIIEKLETDRPTFKRMFNRMEFIFRSLYSISFEDYIEHYTGEWEISDFDNSKLIQYFQKNPKDGEFFYSILRIADETIKYGIESLEYMSEKNLGYKKSGAIAFFDIGAADFDTIPIDVEKVNVKENGSSKFSTDNSIGQDDFPAYNQNDTSPLTDNNVLPVDEDLEYNHVVGNASEDEYMMTERKLSYMPDAKAVTVKKKCRLGGLGNTSAACNQGDIGNLELKNINEEETEVLGERNDEVSDNISDEPLKKLIKGKKDIALAKLNKGNIRNVEKEGLRIIMLRTTNIPNEWISIVYRENKKADAVSLYNIAKMHGLSLVPTTEEDARTIFGLLQYSDAAIEEYIRRKFGKLNEQETDTIMQKLDKTFIRNEDDAKVMAVNGSAVKESGFIEFVEGGHHYVDVKDPESEQKYAKFIPEDEIWIDDVFQSKPIDMEAIILHEKLERHLMKKYGYSYDRGHGIANFAETIFRNKAKEGSGQNMANSIFNVFVRKFSNPNLPIDEQLKKKSNKTYYRAVDKNAGEIVEFQPEGYYEAIDNEGNPVIKYDTHWVSDKPEVAASHSVGGAVLGLYSMFRQHGKVPNIFYIYEINEEPDVDISHWDMGDFSYLQEVRYRRPVQGKYVGRVTITDDLKQKLNAFYEIISSDEYEQPIYDPEYEKQQRIFQDTDYDELLSGVKNMIHENLIKEAQLMSLQELPFKDEVLQLGGKIYSVGGAVRDEFLGKESKDLDILITGIPMDELETLLSKYGRVDAVGKSFGVLKFRPQGGEEIDIAIPRTEKPTGAGGHQGFDVTSDHALPIEKDLERRDFTINAIAKDIEGNVVDPFGGQEDLKNKIIRIVNPEAFSDDPLRMLRAVQFASRFGFTIESETMKMIRDNASRIKEIPPERILTEFDKIIKKGNKLTGAQLLKDTGLFQQIFGFDIKQSTIDRSSFDDVKTMGEFIFLLTRLLPNPAEFYRNNLRGDIDTYKEIKALQMAYESGEATSLIEARSVAHNMYLVSPQSLQSDILPNIIKTAANELLEGKYPKITSELALNGNELMELGLQGKEIGDMQKILLLKIYSDNLRNDKKELTTFVNDTQVLDEKK